MSREHVFGSLSTDLKLSMVGDYLRAFTTALKDKPKQDHRFALWYIDAFAGTGERTLRLALREPGLWEPTDQTGTMSRRGSARIAIETEPRFDRLIFLEQKRRHVAALEDLKSEYPGRDIRIQRGDANQLIQVGLERANWRGTRAVMFLDPYGMGVEWDTLRAIRQTAAIDVWYLVSLAGLYRQATHKGSSLDDKKRAAITRMLGTSDWMSAWYRLDAQPDLLESQAEERRIADPNRIEGYVTQRLESLFPTVLGPRRLYNDRGAPMFALYFLMANRSPAARRVAEPIANHILAAGRSSQVRPS